MGYLSNAYHFSLLAEQLGLFYSALSTYYLGASLVCIAGIIGVIKNKVNYVKVYAYFYWWQLLIGFSLSIFFSIIAFYYDKDICEKLVEQPELHFCLAVWAYYQKLKMEEKQSEIPNPDYVVYYTPVPAYAVSPPPAYDSVASSQIDGKTNVNNNTDQKSTTTVNVVESD
ncbi:9453_t:CDS:2, partial [Entrophospora sp. SA101]